MIIGPRRGRLVPDRVIENARLDPIAKEGLFTGPVTRGAGSVGSVVEFLSTIVKDLDDYAIMGWGIRTFRARDIVTSVGVGECLCVRIVIVVLYMRMEADGRGAVTDIGSEEDGGG